MATADEGQLSSRPVDPRKAKMAAECFRRGNEAIPKANWDYAIEMYTTASKLVPDNLMFRQTLRATEQKKYGGNGSGAMLASMRLMSVRTRIKKARMSKQWDVINDTAEEGLIINPWDPQLNADVGEACRELGYQEVAIFGYEESLKADPTNAEINEALAEILEERGEYKRATECWERILKASPLNGRARSKIAALQTESVIDRGGYRGADSTQNVLADTELARRLGRGQEADAPGMSAEKDLIHQIRKEPENKDLYLKLADLYRRDGELQKAEVQITKALEVSGGNINIREMLEDVQLEMMRQSLTIAKEMATQTPDDPALKQRAGELARELIKREIEIYTRRIDRYPADMRLKFELATRQMRLKNWQAAIPLLQISRQDPRLKAEALTYLGKCFTYDGKIPLARRQFEAAVPEVSFETNPDLFRDLHYSLGRICEELKDVPAAEKYYQEVLGVDYGYRDTVQRLDRLQTGASPNAT